VLGLPRCWAYGLARRRGKGRQLVGRAVGRGCGWAEKRERTGRRGWATEMRKEGEEEKMGRQRIERAGRLGQN